MNRHNSREKTLPPVSIVVICFNDAPNLARCLSSVRRLNRYGAEIEVVVVDGGSSDGSQRVATAHGARLIEASTPNIPCQRNLGFRAAKHDMLAYLDADCTVHPSWLIHASSYFTRLDRFVVGAARGLPERSPWVCRAVDLHLRCKHARVGTEQGYRQITTQNLVTTRRTIESLGGFDENLRTSEDFFFLCKARAAGIPVLCDQRLEHVHYGEPRTLGELFWQQAWHFNHRQIGRTLLNSSVRRGAMNALAITLLTLGLVLVGIGSVVWFAVTGHAWPIGLSVLGAVLVFGGSASRTAYQARCWRWAPALAVVYFFYGLGRAAGLVSFGRINRWR